MLGARAEQKLGPRGTVIFPIGEVHQVEALTRMVLYRIQAGPDPLPVTYEKWPDRVEVSRRR